MTTIQYIRGDATEPIGEGNKIIVHVCNDIGAWGKGFVLAISKRWEQPEAMYRKWAKYGPDFGLGKIQFVQVESSIWVANLIGQHDIRKGTNSIPPIRYEAIQSGIQLLAEFALQHHASVHMPRIGCGLAGGTWDKIEPILLEELSKKNIKTTVYDFV